MKIIECPRDAMQGITAFIPTEKKVLYLNQLLKVGFDTLDFGSFVSAKAIPQMRDTVRVLESLDWESSTTSLLGIVANVRGAEEATQHAGISYLGFPLSISETFQMRNTNKSIAEALNSLAEIQNLCSKANKKLVTYISMAFGNPYGDPYAPERVAQFVDVLTTLGCDIISLADTIGAATPEEVKTLFSSIPQQNTKMEIGVHLHARPHDAVEKIKAAYEAGCKRFDGAIKGYGGCPMAKDELVGNIATENILHYFDSIGEKTGIDTNALKKALVLAGEIFPKR